MTITKEEKTLLLDELTKVMSVLKQDLEDGGERFEENFGDWLIGANSHYGN